MTDTAAPSFTRTVDDLEVPIPGAWSVDKSHAEVGFVARHLVVSKVRGRFTDFDADVVIGERPEDSSVAVTIQAASITTGDDQRDGHLRSPDFLDVEQHPTLTYRSTGVRHAGGDRWVLDGELTVRGVTRSVPLTLTYGGVVRDPWGGASAHFEAEAEIDREDFGLTWNQALESGGVLVGKKVIIEISLEAKPPSAD